MTNEYDGIMERALAEAEKGLAEGEVPIGAVLLGADGKIIAKGHNQPVTRQDPTAHAEILTLRSAGRSLHNYRLPGTTLVVTLEPCVMCMGAAIHARISRLVFGAFDKKSGAAGSLYNLAEDNRLNHQMEVIPGVMEEACVGLLQSFFSQRREKNSI
jgi:tRNA(adenine34) deaminase